jgi:hypothetical protein
VSVPIDEVLDRLHQAWVTAGQEPLPGPGDSIDRVLADIASVIAPWRLPDEILTFWRRLAPEYLESLSPFPPPTSPEFALHCWLEHAKEQRSTPALLFPIAYQGHHFTFVELARDDDPGGAIFDWSCTGPGFQLTHSSLSSYLDQWTTMVELGEYVVLELPDGREFCEFDPLEQWSQIAAVRLAPSLPLPRYGTKVTIGGDPREWPQHWLLPDGCPQGADTTVAALLKTAISGVESRGTIHATVSRSVRTAVGQRLTVQDATGQLDVWCPSAVDAHLHSARLLEFQVVLRPRPAGPPAAQEADLYAALFDSPADAIATAIRPVE